jgi:hypothetical protein
MKLVMMKIADTVRISRRVRSCESVFEWLFVLFLFHGRVPAAVSSFKSVTPGQGMLFVKLDAMLF